MGQIDVLRYILKHPVNRGYGLSAIRNYMAWQVGSRLVPGAVAVPFANDSILMTRPGMHGATQNVYCGLNDFSDMGFLLHLLRPSDLFADVGANVGSYTVLASAAIGARTIAFEPNPVTFPDLVTNINANGVADRVDARLCGVGSKAGTLRFQSSGPTTRVAARASKVVSDLFESPVVTMNEALADSTPTLIKIDVEGFESDVLAGAAQVLRRSELLALIIENNEDCLDFGFTLDQAHNLLQTYGFAAATYDPRTRKLEILSEGNPVSMNSLYVRNLSTINDRLQSAAAFRVKAQSI